MSEYKYTYWLTYFILQIHIFNLMETFKLAETVKNTRNSETTLNSKIYQPTPPKVLANINVLNLLHLWLNFCEEKEK